MSVLAAGAGAMEIARHIMVLSDSSSFLVPPISCCGLGLYVPGGRSDFVDSYSVTNALLGARLCSLLYYTPYTNALNGPVTSKAHELFPPVDK
jgi:hypothetical protein